MSSSGDILRLSNDLMAVGLVGENVGYVKKKKKKVKDIVDIGVKNVIGSSMIKTNAEFLWD